MRKAKGRKISPEQPRATRSVKAAEPRARPGEGVDRSEPVQGPGPSHAFVQPLQSPPAGREYLRALIGKQAKPAPADPRGTPQAMNEVERPSGNYFVQLSTFHIRGF